MMLNALVVQCFPPTVPPIVLMNTIRKFDKKRRELDTVVVPAFTRPTQHFDEFQPGEFDLAFSEVAFELRRLNQGQDDQIIGGGWKGSVSHGRSRSAASFADQKGIGHFQRPEVRHVGLQVSSGSGAGGGGPCRAAEACEVVRGHGASWADLGGRNDSWTASLPIGRVLFDLWRTPSMGRCRGGVHRSVPTWAIAALSASRNGGDCNQAIAAALSDHLTGNNPLTFPLGGSQRPMDIANTWFGPTSILDRNLLAM